MWNSHPELCVTAPSAVIQHLPGPELRRSLSGWFQLGSLAKGHSEHVQGAPAHSLHPSCWEPAGDTHRSTGCPARCAQPLEAFLGPACPCYSPARLQWLQLPSDSRAALSCFSCSPLSQLIDQNSPQTTGFMGRFLCCQYKELRTVSASLPSKKKFNYLSLPLRKLIVLLIVLFL